MIDQGTNVPFVKKRNILVNIITQQKGHKASVIQKKKCILIRRLEGVLSSKDPQLKEGRNIYIKKLELTKRCCYNNRLCRSVSSCVHILHTW